MANPTPNEKEIIEKFFSKLIAIHLTNYFPKKGIIKTRFGTRPRTWFRDTVHFAINEPVGDVPALSSPNFRASSWEIRKFAILIPFDRLYLANQEKLKVLSGRDTFFTGNITIPEDSIVIVMGIGLKDLKYNGIISQEEYNKLIGMFNISSRVRREFLLKRKVDGIGYRIYSGEKAIKEVVLDIIKELGYQVNDITNICSKELGIPIWDVDAILGLDRKAHYEHWTASLEDFLGNIFYAKEQIILINQAIAKLKEREIIFPTYLNGEKEFYISEDDENYVDSRGRLFNGKEISDFSRTELNALKFLVRSSWSADEINTLQFPFRVAKYLLNEVPEKYHKRIRQNIRSYQNLIKRNLPKKIISLCPKLSELLKEVY